MVEQTQPTPTGEVRSYSRSQLRFNLGAPNPENLDQMLCPSFEDVALASYPELEGKSEEDLRDLMSRYLPVVKREASILAKWLTEAFHDTESAEFAADVKPIRKAYKRMISGTELAQRILREPVEDVTRTETEGTVGEISPEPPQPSRLVYKVRNPFS